MSEKYCRRDERDHIELERAAEGVIISARTNNHFPQNERRNLFKRMVDFACSYNPFRSDRASQADMKIYKKVMVVSEPQESYMETLIGEKEEGGIDVLTVIDESPWEYSGGLPVVSSRELRSIGEQRIMPVDEHEPEQMEVAYSRRIIPELSKHHGKMQKVKLTPEEKRIEKETNRLEIEATKFLLERGVQ